MPRIPQETIERLKAEVDLAALVRQKGVELAPHGKDLIGLCPFHDDHEPSLVVTSSKNLWHCLGACQQGGSVIDWVMKAEGFAFREAVEHLSREVLSLPSTEQRPSPPAPLVGTALIAADDVQMALVSPAASEGSKISGISGVQGSTR